MHLRELLQHAKVLHEVTSYLTLPELLELRVVSTDLQSLVDGDDLWERRFLADANPLTQAILFCWIEHLLKATNVEKNELETTRNAPSYLRWLFKPSMDTMLSSSAAVRQSLLQLLKAQLSSGSQSRLFDGQFWSAYFPLDLSEEVAPSSSEEATVTLPTVTHRLTGNYFARVSKVDNDGGSFISGLIGFENIRLVLFEAQTVKRCYQTALMLQSQQPQRVRGQAQTTSLDSPLDLQPKMEDQPLFTDWKEVYQFFLVPLPTTHPFETNSHQSCFNKYMPIAVGIWKIWLCLRSLSTAVDPQSPGIHRGVFHFQSALYVRCQRARLQGAWMLTLSWLTGSREDLAPFVNRLTSKTPHKPKTILMNLSQLWRVGQCMLATAIGSCVLLSSARARYLIFANGLPVVAIGMLLIDPCRNPGTPLRDKIGQFIKNPVQLLLRAGREVLKPASVSDFTPLAAPLATKQSRFKWILYICLERYKFNAGRVVPMAVSFLFGRMAVGLAFWGASSYLRIVDSSWLPNIFYYLTAHQLSTLAGKFFTQRQQNQKDLLYVASKDYPPTEAQLQNNSVNTNVFGFSTNCECFSCNTTVGASPQLLWLLRQLSILECCIIPLAIALPVHSFGSLGLFTLDSEGESLQALLLSHVVEPMILWCGGAALGLTVTFSLQVAYWYRALQDA